MRRAPRAGFGLAVAALLIPTPALARPAVRPLVDCLAIDGSLSTVDIQSPVLRSATLSFDPTRTSALTTSGYDVDRVGYAQSVALTSRLRWHHAWELVCGDRAVLRLQSVVSGAAAEPAALEQEFAVPGDDGWLSLTTLVTDLPVASDGTAEGPCVAVRLEVLNSAGVVVQRAPSAKPLVLCPGAAGEVTYGG